VIARVFGAPFSKYALAELSLVCSSGGSEDEHVQTATDQQTTVVAKEKTQIPLPLPLPMAVRRVALVTGAAYCFTHATYVKESIVEDKQEDDERFLFLDLCFRAFDSDRDGVLDGRELVAMLGWELYGTPLAVDGEDDEEEVVEYGSSSVDKAQLQQERAEKLRVLVSRVAPSSESADGSANGSANGSVNGSTVTMSLAQFRDQIRQSMLDEAEDEDEDEEDDEEEDVEHSDEGDEEDGQDGGGGGEKKRAGGRQPQQQAGPSDGSGDGSSDGSSDGSIAIATATGAKSAPTGDKMLLIDHGDKTATATLAASALQARYARWVLRCASERLGHELVRVGALTLGVPPGHPEEEAALIRTVYQSYRTAEHAGELYSGQQWYLVERGWWLHWAEYVDFYQQRPRERQQQHARDQQRREQLQREWRPTPSGGSSNRSVPPAPPPAYSVGRPRAIRNPSPQPSAHQSKRQHSHYGQKPEQPRHKYQPLLPAAWHALQRWYGGGPILLHEARPGMLTPVHLY
jgi:hypothetical protein